jgi:hypothetical protein
MIHIITPCSRPGNLTTIKANHPRGLQLDGGS